MQKFLTFMLAATAIAGSATAQTSPPFAPLTTDIMAPKPHSAYVQDSRGVIARNPFGLCWRTGYWTPADAVPGCDLPICVEPAILENGKCVTPAPVIVAPPVVEPAKPAEPEPAPSSEKVSFAADTLFDFDKSVLKPAGKEKLDDLVSKLEGINLEVVVAVGHTDAIGTDAYNEKLSMRRAASVKAYLESKGIEPARIYTEGKGETQPVASNKTAEGRALNRRVEVEVVGTRSK